MNAYNTIKNTNKKISLVNTSPDQKSQTEQNPNIINPKGTPKEALHSIMSSADAAFVHRSK